jgi:ABC-type uncharacterized transport system substrate-binding protein
MLREARPRDTPAQQPSHYELILNLRTLKALGAAIPTTLVAEADEVIE